MEFIEFLGMIIIATMIFTPMNKKYKLRAKYHNNLNKHFRFFMFIPAFVSLVIELLIAILKDDYLQVIGINWNLISFIFSIPMFFLLIVAVPTIKEYSDMSMARRNSDESKEVKIHI